MSNHMVTQSGTVLAAFRSAWTPEQMKLITDVVAKGATPDELKLFLYRCEVMDLDPLKPGQIYFIKYGNSPGTIVVGIEGFRAKANKTGKLSGIKRGVLRDEKGKCIGAWAEVFRKDWNEPAREEVSLSEYTTGKAMWAKMPEQMIKKVAEASALRMAFPDDLGGIYESSEMDQAKPVVRTQYVAPEQPPETDGHPHDPDDYLIPFGKYAKRRLTEIDLTDLRNYVQWMIDNAEKKGQPLRADGQDFVERASKYIADIENAPLFPEPGSDG